MDADLASGECELLSIMYLDKGSVLFLPNVDEIVIDEAKIIDYLLSDIHPVGKYKARFFKRLGYNKNRSQELKSDIQQFAEIWQVTETVETRFGIHL